MSKSPILAGEPFSPQKTQEILDRFARDGYCHIPGVLTPGEVSALRDRSEELMDDPEILARFNPVSPGSTHWRGGRYLEVQAHATSGEMLPFILRNQIELDQMFRDLLVREPIFSLAEAVLGKKFKYCAQNVIRASSGMSIDHFHSDGDAFFPLPDSIKRHDPRVRMPVMWIGVQMALTDIETIEDGPTQYVPGSHYSGRALNRNHPPDDPENPQFDGKGPVSVFCKAGDIYLHDPMCWHRGAPNTTDRRRYLLQSQYASSQAYRIGHGFNQYTPEPVNNDMLRTGSDQFLNLLGRPRPDGA